MISRSKLARTLEDLAARADRPARVRSHDGGQTAKVVAASAAHQAAAVAGAAAGRVQAHMDSLRGTIERTDLATIVRRPVPLGAILGGAAAFGVIVYVASRSRQ